MPDWSQIYDNARTRKARAPERRRALDPDTGLTIPRLTFKHKTALSVMDRIKKFIIPWILRRLLTALSAFAAVSGATQEDTQHTAAFLTAGVVFGMDCLIKWVRLYWQGLTNKKAAPVLGLLLLIGLCLGGLPACQAVKPKPATADAPRYIRDPKPNIVQEFGGGMGSLGAGMLMVGGVSVVTMVPGILMGTPLYLIGYPLYRCGKHLGTYPPDW